MSLVLQSSGGGQITIQEPATASNFTQTLPAASGEVMVAGNMPAFSAYGGAQTLTTAVATKIANNTEVFDTNNNFDSTTNYRFTPAVAGYYQVTAAIRDSTGATVGALNVSIYKNGSAYSSAQFVNSNQGISAIVTSLIYMNGSTDYVEQYVTQNSGLNMAVGANQNLNYFQAVMVRAA
jgi:hypothetical protein